MKQFGNIGSVPIDEAGGIPVNLQDQTTKPVILYFNQVKASTTLAAAATKDTYTIEVDDATGFTVGKYIILFDLVSTNFSFYYATNVAGTTITLDTPLDFDYPAGTNVDAAVTNLAVDGSTPETFGLRGAGIIPGVELTVDITQINFACIAKAAVNLELFADQVSLLDGLVLRKRDGNYTNLVNLKTNFDIATITNDFQIYQATNPAHGTDGFSGCFHFAGQENIGVAIRLPVGDDLEFIVQDDLSAITLLRIVAQGHLLQY